MAACGRIFALYSGRPPAGTGGGGRYGTQDEDEAEMEASIRAATQGMVVCLGAAFAVCDDGTVVIPHHLATAPP